MDRRKGGWQECAKVLKDLETHDVEELRRSVLGYARSCLLGGGPTAARAYLVIREFRYPVADAGPAGLAAAAYEVFHGG